VTSGGDLEITLNVMWNMTQPTAVACEPVIDGVWAGTYGGLPDGSPPPYWREGAVEVSNSNFNSSEPITSFLPWFKTRIYPGIPAGMHVITAQCYTNTGSGEVGPAIGPNSLAIPGSLSVVELP